MLISLHTFDITISDFFCVPSRIRAHIFKSVAWRSVRWTMETIWVTKENRTPIYRTTIYRVNRYTIATIFKPINVGLRCTLFNPLSHPSLLKSCQYRIPHLRFCTLGRNWTFFSFLSGMCANHSTTRAILPHFTGLMDRLPYGSGGFPLFRDSALPGGLEPP